MMNLFIRQCNDLMDQQLVHDNFTAIVSHIRQCARVQDFLPELLYAYRVGREGQSVSRESRIAHKADTVDSIRRILYFCGKKVSPDHPNRHAIRERAGVYLIYAFLTLMLEKPSVKNYRELLSLMSYAKRISPDICEEAKRRKRLIRLLYASCGAAYFACAGRIDNWN